MNPVTAFLIVFLLSLIAFATFGLELVLSCQGQGCPNPTFGSAIFSSILLGLIAGIAESPLRLTIKKALQKEYETSLKES